MDCEDKPHIGVEELRDQLDVLWEKHLVLLDSYHQAQQDLARHFSSGFFNLAQATFKSTNRVRYGQEYYDDRMQATRRFQASVDHQDMPHLALRGDDTTSPSTEPSIQDSELNSTREVPQRELADQKEDAPVQQPTPPPTPGPQHEEDSAEAQSQPEESESSADKEKTHKKPRDPLHWYGILVPPALRSSQRSFLSAIEDPMLQAANSAQALRHVTLDIRKLRKDIKKAEKRVA